MSASVTRRKFLKNSVAASVGATVALSLEEKILLANQSQESNESKPPTPVKGLPTGKIGKVTLSRLIAGGNLIGGWAHSRDLIYVSELLKAYNTEQKIMETLQLCEQNGINTILVNPTSLKVINKYWKERGGKMQVICECHPKPDEDIKPSVRKAIDGGASLVYMHGGLADELIDRARVDIIAQAVDYIKQNELPAGVGGHCLQVPIECEKFAVEPDFYVKTLHHDNYWSANPPQFRTEPTKGFFPGHHNSHDNIWCINPQETIDFMKNIERPWIAFKVLAAGAIHPKDGFKFAYENGADFICAGMFDFQVAEDAAIAKNVLAELSKIERTRPWRA